MNDIFDLTDLSDLPAQIRQHVTPKPQRAKREKAKRQPWIVDLLALAGRPLSANEILVARIRTAAKGTPGTVYSALQNAIKAGLIIRTGTRNDRRYELVADQEADDAA